MSMKFLPAARITASFTAACMIPWMTAGAAGGNSHDTERVNEIMRRAGCLMCHRSDRPWIGPSFQEIAKNNRGMAPEERALLVQRLRGGAVGNYAPIRMSPCDPRRASDEELLRVIDHVLNHEGAPDGRKR